MDFGGDVLHISFDGGNKLIDPTHQGDRILFIPDCRSFAPVCDLLPLLSFIPSNPQADSIPAHHLTRHKPSTPTSQHNVCPLLEFGIVNDLERWISRSLSEESETGTSPHLPRPLSYPSPLPLSDAIFSPSITSTPTSNQTIMLF